VGDSRHPSQRGRAALLVRLVRRDRPGSNTRNPSSDFPTRRLAPAQRTTQREAIRPIAHPHLVPAQAAGELSGAPSGGSARGEHASNGRHVEGPRGMVGHECSGHDVARLRPAGRSEQERGHVSQPGRSSSPVCLSRLPARPRDARARDGAGAEPRPGRRTATDRHREVFSATREISRPRSPRRSGLPRMQ
jgi:hypothetical protein